MKIICIGRNYELHAKELNNSIPKDPIIFLKPASSLLLNQQSFKYPNFSSNIHYECEVVLKINKTIKNISEKEAASCYDEWTLGIDFTARDLQDNLKNKKLPWEISKAFDHSAVVGNFIKIEKKHLPQTHFEFYKNGEIVQTGYIKDLIFSFEKIIAYASQFFTLETGDLIFTGTPAGVGPIEIHDEYTGFLMGKHVLSCKIEK